MTSSTEIRLFIRPRVSPFARVYKDVIRLLFIHVISQHTMSITSCLSSGTLMQQNYVRSTAGVVKLTYSICPHARIYSGQVKNFTLLVLGKVILAQEKRCILMFLLCTIKLCHGHSLESLGL